MSPEPSKLKSSTNKQRNAIAKSKMRAMAMTFGTFYN
jgi:hypothetical protein